MTTTARVFLSLVFCTTIACGSGPKISEHGFTATPLGANSFAARFEGRSMSEKDAVDNLLYHAARKTLDDGNLYFVVEDLSSKKRLDAGSKQTVESAPSQPDPEDPNAGRGMEPSYSTRVTVQGVVTSTGTVHMFKERPSGEGVYEASKVIETIRR